MHTAALADYDKLINGGYDKKFKTYADAVVKSGKAVVNKFMYDKGNDYFTCDVTEVITCCKYCKYVNNPGNGECRWCGGSCGSWDTVCENPEVLCGEMPTSYENKTGPCSPDFSLRAGPEPADGYANAIYWKFRDDLLTNTGISEDSIKFTNVHHVSECAPTDKHCKDRSWDYNYPVLDGYDREDIIDPKDVVSEAYNNLKNISTDLDDVSEMIKNEMYEADTGDLVDSLALPILMIKGAVKQMSDIIDTVDDMEEEKRKNIILAFLFAIFFFLPIAGQIIGTVAALANFAHVIATIGVLGDIALDIQSIVEGKNNLPLAIFGIVLSPLALMDAAKIAKAVSTRREMTTEQVGKLGERVSKPLESIAKMKGGVCTRPGAFKRDLPFGAIPREFGFGMSPVNMRGYNLAVLAKARFL
ncbi:hypothetical protein K458DRAFT_428109 [Lentithecium fluviatile CBS 122367]|uniref:Uncharacterized protein n=1 Tax=Lentithecium fluviatile CBS 122367 TaxID=1168545 RepID=A0A6G1JDB4_9PLEO|nr:hypothetical protein K458DRAFT_428109 [Lentithecium fluviatile CBS 122367]